MTDRHPSHESTQERLIFVVSPPRAGSTLLQRMLGAHSAIFTHPEPHLITPLAHLGYYDNVEKAPYDHINAAEAMRSLVNDLPRGEEDYLDALRAYADTLYSRMLATSDRDRFLDKTPANALVLPFLARLYPNAKFIVLTRHPLAVFSSFANSFFDGDWNRARDYNPILARYVPAMANFLRERPVAMIQVGYESLVTEPELQLERMFAFLGLPHQPEAVEYGGTSMKKGMGDPITVQKHSRPVTDSLMKWAEEISADDQKRRLARQMIDRLSDDDLTRWGFPRERLWEPLLRAGNAPPPKPVLNSYTFQRKVMLALKKDIHARPHGKVLKRAKYFIDVLLRE